MRITEKNNFLKKFQPAQLKETKTRWYIDYYVLHPETGVMVRKIIKLNRIKNITERRRFAKKTIQEINQKLHDGWNPFLVSEAPNSFIRLDLAIDQFLKSKIKELRDKSVDSYNSFTKTLLDWCKKYFKKDIFLVTFDDNTALKFMDYVYFDKKVANTTFNNYLRFFSGLFNWFVARKMYKSNPFAGIRVKKSAQKRRIKIDLEHRESIKKYLEQTNKPYLFVCLLAYGCLIRRSEATKLKVGDINFNNQTILVSGEIAKSGRTRVATIPNYLMPLIYELNIDKANKKNYLISKKDFTNGTIIMHPKRISDCFTKMRVALKLPQNISFYSLRDTGIIQMLDDGISPQKVQMQADHSSLEITSIYARHSNASGEQQIKDKTSDF